MGRIFNPLGGFRGAACSGIMGTKISGRSFPDEEDNFCKKSGVLRALHRAVRGAADGVPRDRECGPDLPADAYSRAAVRTGLRVAVRPRLRRAGAGAVRRADGDACPGCAARHDGRMRRLRAGQRSDDAARPHEEAVRRPVYQPDHGDAAGTDPVRRVQGAALRARDVYGRGVGHDFVRNRPARHRHPACAAADACRRADEGAAAACAVRIRSGRDGTAGCHRLF